MNPQKMLWNRLLSACARSRSDDALWREFLGRYASWIMRFITKARAVWSSETGASPEWLPGAVDRSDLLQSVMVRLVENRCAALKAFSGDTEAEWLSYVAAISASVVRATFRREVRAKRQAGATIEAMPFAEYWQRAQDQKRNQYLEIEKGVLVSELRVICERVIRNVAGEHSDRDMLIFRLYFIHGVSISQIAAWREIRLSRSGVGYVIERLAQRVRHAVNKEPPQIARSSSERGKVVGIDELQREREREDEVERKLG